MRHRSTNPAHPVAALAAAAVLTACSPAAPTAVPSEIPSATPTSSPSVSTPSGSASATPSPNRSTAPASPTPPVATVTVRITGGKVQGGVQTVKVPAGHTVRLTGVSDVADSLHVHGYDETLQLTPGKEASLTFTAEVGGVFEIETHETGKLVAKLQVS